MKLEQNIWQFLDVLVLKILKKCEKGSIEFSHFLKRLE